MNCNIKLLNRPTKALEMVAFLLSLLFHLSQGAYVLEDACGRIEEGDKHKIKYPRSWIRPKTVTISCASQSPNEIDWAC